jgi:hypothetical protein
MTPQGKADKTSFEKLFIQHILPAHLGPPHKATELCCNEAMRISDDRTRNNKAATFTACITAKLEAAGHTWQEHVT